MRICLIAEGCYPYVAGGVSAWIQMLIKGMPQHEFVIFTIGAEKAQKGQYKYELPSNVVDIQEYFLDEYLDTNKKSRFPKFQSYKLKKEERQIFVNMLQGDEVNWDLLFQLFEKNYFEDSIKFLSSKAFLEIIKTICSQKYENEPFNEVFWTIRSMLIPLLSILKSAVPEADLYHSVSTGYAGIVGAKFKRATGKPFLLTEHGIYTREREEEILKADWVEGNFKGTWIHFFGSLSQGAYEGADAIVALFKHAQDLQIQLGAPKSKCSIITNGIDISRFQKIEPIKAYKRDLVIGAIVRVVPIKDIKTMIYAFDLVKKELPHAKLYIIGPTEENPEYYEECLELIESLQCGDIVFTGRVNIDQWMGKLDMVILTSVSEGQPFVLLEAMASKRPVIATNVGACKEIIYGADDEFGAAGFVVPVMAPYEMARSIIKLGEDRKTLMEMGERGYKRVLTYYRRESFLQEYENLYRSVMP